MLTTLLALALAHPADAAPKTLILPDDSQARAFFENYGFVEAVVRGDTVWLSGVVAGEREGVTMEQSIVATFDYAGTVLERAGFGWGDVVDITTYHVDLPASIDSVSAVKFRYIPDGGHAWTAIDVDRLYPDNAIVEIKITAVKD
ncbi:Rid family hydrolase [Sphingomicrobium astaxanthinifaciens]|uniref:Rid family hydrolase n=1 Tax=Sphingomicrobium astaxanthinifaciens TaxID=1227949 RepID=UPI001FCC1707|nr:Rid family hydrolase [Sphingomicrobium astaxanthinifaciens]MCJ7421255.1 Rid family hydrolase [Sphingomicrobium astaxanthinifaciens]